MLRILLTALLLICTTVHAVSMALPYDERLRQALMLQQARQWQQALQVIGNLDMPDVPTPLLARLCFLRAMLALSLSMPETAMQDLQYILQSYPPLADYAGWHLLQYFAAQDRLVQAETVLTTLTTHYPFSLLLPEAYLLLAQTQIRLAQPAQAQAIVEHLRNTYRRHPLLPEALVLLARIYEDSGNLVAAAQTLQQLGEAYPTHALATEALQRSALLLAQLPPEQRPVPAPEQLLGSLDGLMQARQWQEVEARLAVLEKFAQPPALVIRVGLKRATVALRRQSFDQARTAVYTLLQQYPAGDHVAEALYLLGRIEQQQNKTADSERRYRRVITEYATTSWAAEALAALAQMSEDRQDLAGAGELYQRLVQYFPTHEKAEEGLWRVGWQQYGLRHYEVAETLFRHFEAYLPGAELLPQVLYWHARAAQNRGQQQTAERLYRRIVDDYPFHYYSLHAAEHLQHAAPSTRKPPQESLPTTMWGEAPPVLLPAVYPVQPSQTQFHFMRVHELQQLQMYQEAAREIRHLATLLPDAAATRYFLGALCVENHSYLAAFRHFNSLLKTLRPDEVRGLPRTFWAMLYPRVFWEDVAQQAQTAGLNPYLVLSIMRQESAFQPTVVSSAGAIGLMQLLPGTAKMVSKQHGLRQVTDDLLTVPQFNITLGTRYFASMLQRYRGNMVLALAAYNAGTGRADRWQKQWPGLPMDEFVEYIPFRETRFYVKLVLRNLLNYERLYKVVPDG